MSGRVSTWLVVGSLQNTRWAPKNPLPCLVDTFVMCFSHFQKEHTLEWDCLSNTREEGTLTRASGVCSAPYSKASPSTSGTCWQFLGLSLPLSQMSQGPIRCSSLSADSRKSKRSTHREDVTFLKPRTATTEGAEARPVVASSFPRRSPAAPNCSPVSPETALKGKSRETHEHYWT